MTSNETSWITYGRYTPYVDRPFEIQTEHGIRQVIFDSHQMRYRATDCTHPMQNTSIYMSPDTRWRYINQKDTDDLLFQVNHYQREKDGQEILQKIKSPTLLQGLKAKINNLIQRKK